MSTLIGTIVLWAALKLPIKQTNISDWSIVLGCGICFPLGVITATFTGHERKTNHFTPARMSAPCASHCYPAFKDATSLIHMAVVYGNRINSAPAQPNCNESQCANCVRDSYGPA